MGANIDNPFTPVNALQQLGKIAQNQLVRLSSLMLILEFFIEPFELILFTFFPDIAYRPDVSAADSIDRSSFSSATGTPSLRAFESFEPAFSP